MLERSSNTINIFFLVEPYGQGIGSQENTKVVEVENVLKLIDFDNSKNQS